MTGVVDAKELAFVAGAGAGNQFRVNGRFNHHDDILARSQSIFAKSAIPIGTSFDVGSLHRVSVRLLPTESALGPVDDGQVKRLEIDIEALSMCSVEQHTRSRHSCCTVQ
jgi:hypothetical protein